MRKKFDDQWYIDFLRKTQKVDNDECYKKVLEVIKDVILVQIEKNQNRYSVSMKYQWSKNYFNNVIKDLAELNGIYKELAKQLYIGEKDE
ncbi:hypothetical protein CON15_23100 [Bacillus cereus]|nr:hypothetical protein CON15_23100 [Bacillus cereus]PET98221.1 hypothetical protein CN531_30680 [Bacillus cereus]PEW62964.1 hypothetical protein CN443_09680 [Bacillus cereus]PEX34188.1 hypothetical protein CN459_07205 [Bacillus cereus]PEY21293.1 hypothetical protein CN331_09945 [Bacillus cereus]